MREPHEMEEDEFLEAITEGEAPPSTEDTTVLDASRFAAREMCAAAVSSADIHAAVTKVGAVVVLVAPTKEWGDVICDEWQKTILGRKPVEYRLQVKSWRQTARFGGRWTRAHQIPRR